MIHARGFRHTILMFVMPALIVLQGEIAGAQDAPAKENANQLPDLPADLLQVLREQFPDYVLPLSKKKPAPKPTNESVQEAYHFEISNKPLAEALYNRKSEEAQRLIKSGHPTNEVHDGRNALHFAARNGDARTCQLLLDAGLDIHQKDARHKPYHTPLQLAVLSGSVPTVKLLLSRGAKLSPVESWEWGHVAETPLVSLAIRSGNPEMLHALVEKGENAGDFRFVQEAIMMPQSAPKRLEFVKTLLSEGATKTLKASDPDPFILAFGTGDINLVRLLEDNNIPVNYGQPHLHSAVLSGDIETCRDVIAKGVKAVANPPVGQELLRIALIDHRSIELADLVVEAGETKRYCVQTDACTSYCQRNEFAHPIYHAAMNDDLDLCRYLIREFSSDPNFWSPIAYEPYEYENDIEFFQKGNTVLFSTVYKDNSEALKLLLKHALTSECGQPPKIDINAKNWCGNTVLHEAVNFGAAKCVQVLLAAGADPNIPRNDGCTPLHVSKRRHLTPHQGSSGVAMQREMSEIFPMLVAASLTSGDHGWINRKNRNGETILHRHARAGHPAICHKLIELGAHVNATNKFGQTPLHYAFRDVSEHQSPEEKQRHLETCLVLLENGTDLRQEGVQDDQLYERQAVAKNLYQVFDAILDQGIKPDVSKNAGHLMCSAAKYGNQNRIKQLLDWGADINAQGNEKSTALHLASRNKDLAMCKFLLDNDADVNAKDERGQTPLFELFDRWAIYGTNRTNGRNETAQQKAFPVLQLLLERGADVNVQTKGTTSTNFNGTVLQVFRNMPKKFRDELEKY